MTPPSSFIFEIIDRSQLSMPASLDAFCSMQCDCACPTPLLSRDNKPSIIEGASESVYRCPPELLVDPLTDGYWSVFDPAGEAGVVVLNEAACEFLSCFSSPMSSTTVLDLYSSIRKDAIRALARLMALGLLRSVGKISQPKTDDDPKLLAVWLHVTNRCNLACNYCYLRKTDESMSESTGFGAIDAVIRSAVAEGYSAIKLKYSGGEPSLMMDLVCCLHDYAVQQCQVAGIELQAVILSNGTALDEAGIKRLKRRGIRVMISLDNLHQAPNAQRPFHSGMDSSQQVIQNIERLIEHDLPPQLSITITGRNCETIGDVVRFALSRDLAFSLNFYRENDHSISSPDLRYSEDRVVEGMKTAFGAIEENLPPWSVVGTILDRGQLVSPCEHACGAARDYMVIDHHGRISKCQMEIDKWVTDIHHRNPLEVIRNSPVGVQNFSSLEKEGCRDCTWRYWCSGGCPLTTYRAFGRYDTRSPNCGIYKAIYPEALRLEGLRLLTYSRQQRGD